MLRARPAGALRSAAAAPGRGCRGADEGLAAVGLRQLTSSPASSWRTCATKYALARPMKHACQKRFASLCGHSKSHRCDSSAALGPNPVFQRAPGGSLPSTVLHCDMNAVLAVSCRLASLKRTAALAGAKDALCRYAVLSWQICILNT